MEDAYRGRLMITRNENTFIDIHTFITFIVGLLPFWESMEFYQRLPFIGGP